jgi:hypothetical protein
MLAPGDVCRDIGDGWLGEQRMAKREPSGSEPSGQARPAADAAELIGMARPRSGGYLQSAAVTVLTLFVGALLTQTLIDDPRQRSEAFAAEVHNFDQLADNARSDFAAAADDQRDAMVGLIHAMAKGTDPKDVEARAEAVKAKFEAYQRAAARLQSLQQNYGPIFSADTRTGPVRELGMDLLGLHYFEQSAMMAASRFKVCLLDLADRYQGNGPSLQANPTQIRCEYTGRTDPTKPTTIAYALYDVKNIRDTSKDAEEDGEFGRLDDCESAIEKRVNFIAASLSSEVEGPGGLDTYLWNSRLWVLSRLGYSTPPGVAVAAPEQTLKDGCGQATADKKHLALLPQPDRSKNVGLAEFHPYASGLTASPIAPASLQETGFQP